MHRHENRYCTGLLKGGQTRPIDTQRKSKYNGVAHCRPLVRREPTQPTACTKQTPPSSPLCSHFVLFGDVLSADIAHIPLVLW